METFQKIESDISAARSESPTASLLHDALERSDVSADASVKGVACEFVRARPVWRGYSSSTAAIWSGVSLACLAAASLMSVGPYRRVSILGFGEPLPEVCSFHRILRIDCPGCGLTRIFVHMMHGEFAAAWALGPVGVCVFFFCVMQVVYGVAQLLFRSRSRWVENWSRVNMRGLLVLTVALTVQWLIKLGDLL